VANGDVVVAEQDLADDEPHDLLALLIGEILCVRGQASAERVERLRQLEIRLGVVQLSIEGVQLGAQGRLAPTQFGHSGAEFLERDQLLLVAVDQSPQRILSTG
jgi:hypothetical protein